MENKTLLTKQTGIKLTLGELVSAKYIQEDEQVQNYLLTQDQRKVYRVNVIGIIVHTQKNGNITNLWLEDGTGKVVVRFFEENKILSTLNPGDILLVIGRIRQYNQEKYLTSEIVKKVDSSWLKLRKIELKEKFSLLPEIKMDRNEKEVKIEEDLFASLPEIKPLRANTKEEVTSALKNKETSPLEEVEEEILEEEIVEVKELLPTQKLLLLIKELDSGNGVLIEEILNKSLLNETEKILEKMLEKGDIFQNLPGRVKVL